MEDREQARVADPCPGRYHQTQNDAGHGGMDPGGVYDVALRRAIPPEWNEQRLNWTECVRWRTEVAGKERDSRGRSPVMEES